MAIPTIFDACVSREDILTGEITDSDFAADLARVLNGTTASLYQDASLFFANTHLTRGLKNLLQNIFAKLCGSKETAASIFRLDINYDGKTGSLIALARGTSGMRGVANVSEFIDPALVPQTLIRVAAFDG